jgi:hypothetical protein
MSAKSAKVENGQSHAEVLRDNELLKKQIGQLQKEKAEHEQTIARLRHDRAYYEKAILALSRSRITADQLAQWLSEEPEEGLTFDEVMAELLDPKAKQ